MAGRPSFIDLQSRSSSAAGSFRLGLPSPRVQHYDGEIPPSLSPLDAFAAQSRKLAMELEAVRNAGSRRMSRLPPAHVSKSLSEHQSDRPRYFRSLSEETQLGVTSQTEEKDGTVPVMTHPEVRPVSEYTRLSGMPNLDSKGPEEDCFATSMEHTPPENPRQTMSSTSSTIYFDAPRAESPEHSSAQSASFGEDVAQQLRGSQSATGLGDVEKRHSTTDSVTSHPDLTFIPAPPPAGFSPVTHHMRIPKESSDDDYTSSFGGSTFSQPRKLSSSSGVSTPQSPRSPFTAPHARSPSLNSELSAGGSRRSRPNLNFSRPRSSASLNRMTADSPSQGQLFEAQMSKYLGVTDGPPPPKPTMDESQPELSEGFLSESSPSYTYARFSLPRGRMVSRNSLLFQGISAPHFEWHEPMFPSTPPTTAISERSLDVPSPPPTLGRPSTSRSEGVRPGHSGFSFDFQQARPKTPDQPVLRSNPTSPSSIQKSPASSTSRPSVERGQSSRLNAAPSILPPVDDIQSLSSKSNSTVRPQSTRTRSTTNTISADEHVAKGIECHENGDVKESTYHLRIAARENHPTGMLLYALACRHGWGMRANPREGVQWLRKAMDSAMLEVANDESNEGSAPGNDLAEKKKRRAQFALSIYELGVSHLNGWGVEQDKALALRCFEIAGSWGDSDALTEAGFCYAEGIGCKKDLKKAAKFYRMAEAKGISMVGNSW
jgi:TPR repeat protein